MLQRLKDLQRTRGLHTTGYEVHTGPYFIRLCSRTTNKDVYASLPKSSTHTRVLDLGPGRYTDELSGTLRVVDLEKAPLYEALSYTWGPALDTEAVPPTVDHYEIRPNLYTALRRLRQAKGVRTIWIDALCINQNNHAERAFQVSIMGTIYERSSTLLIWLGEYSDATAKDVVRARGPYWDPPWRRRIKGLSPKTSRVNSRGRWLINCLEEALRGSTSKWHERAWVVQEYALSPRAVLCFGPITLPFNKIEFGDMTLGLGELNGDLLEFYRKISDMHRLKIFKDRNVRGALSIYEATISTCEASCTHPQDKVYSFLSFVHPKEAELIPVDYNMDAAEVYSRATFAAIVVQGHYGILEFIMFNENPTVPHLPSWAVDFGRQKERYREQMEIGKSSEHRDSAFVRLSSEGKRLFCRGYRIGQVETITSHQGSAKAGLYYFLRDCGHGFTRYEISIIGGRLRGQGIGSIELDDHVVLFMNSDMPVVLREKGSEFIFKGFTSVEHVWGKDPGRWATNEEMFVLC
jgi:hypothetical protein